ncbi:MAG: putative metal-binding motif-containing protein [Sandaracinaceae bacterium]
MTSLPYRRASALAWLVRSLVVASALAWIGCDGDGGTDSGMPDTGVGMDAGRPDSGPMTYPDGTVFCTDAADCDDHIECTIDSCSMGVCRNGVDNAMCDDGLFCNGVEICSPREGCIAGARQTCNDDDVCTIDRCNEETKMCDRFPRDLDDDGDADMFCEGGMDCDDSDPRRSSLVNEVCADLVDNDCDDMVDETDCGRPMYDICEEALDVSAGGYFLLNTQGVAPDYAITCRSFSRDMVARFTLTEARSVTISAEGAGFTTGISLRGPAADFASCDENAPPESEPPCPECTNSSAEMACIVGFPAVVRRRSLAPGTYFVVVGANNTGEIDLNVDFDVPLPPVTNESCTMPLPLTPGMHRDSTVEVTHDLTTSCGPVSAPDLVYSFELTMPQNVQISVTEDDGAPMAYSVRSTCAGPAELRCVTGNPASGTLHQLMPGTYFLIVEGPNTRPADFTIDLQYLPPAPPPPGDACTNPLPVPTDGTPVTGSFASFEDDYLVSCGTTGRDAVYSFTLGAASDVWIDYSGSAVGAVSLRTNCAISTGDLRCIRTNPITSRVRGLPMGTYYVVVEASGGGTYSLSVRATTPPTTPTPVTGNDTCATAATIPETGGIFTGTTIGAIPDYPASCGSGAGSPDSVFELVLSSSRHVTATTEGSAYDTVLHLHQDMCTGSERACNDDAHVGTLTSLVDSNLTAGTYYLIVDGFGTASSGAYTLDVRVE